MNIFPYEAVGPVRFGMDEIEVRAVLGEPGSESTDRGGNRVLRYDRLIVTIGPNGVLEIGISPGSPTSLAGIDLFSSPLALEAVCQMDGAPQEYLGFLVFLNLGITMTGFHDDDESQKALTVFAPGRWDILRSQMKPFQRNKGVIPQNPSP